MKNVCLTAADPLKSWVGVSREEIRRNSVFVLFCFVLFGGIVFGALGSGNADMDTLKRLDFIFLTNFELRCTQGVLSAFVSSFASAAVFMLVIFLLGLSLWGGFAAVLIPFFKGYGYGLSVGYLYGAYGFKGVLYNIAVILPGAFVSSAVIAAASLCAFRSSLHSAVSIFRSPVVRDDPREQMRSYLVRMLKLSLFGLAASIIDVLCAFCFSWLFVF